MILTENLNCCNLCEGVEFKDFYQYEGFHYVECIHCGLISQNPQPALVEINNIYDESYFQYEFTNHNAFFNLMKLGLKDISFDEITSHFGSDKRILDIGCATGLLLNYLKEKGWNTKGVEICKESAQYAINHFNLDIVTKPLSESEFPDNYFHAIHFSHLIEHVPSPYDFLKEVYRILKPGGYAIITTPNVEGLFAKVFRSTWRSAIAQHLFLFSKKTLSNLILKSGFNILKQVSWGGIPIERTQGSIKKITDRWVKFMNIGDVMLFLVQK